MLPSSHQSSCLVTPADSQLTQPWLSRCLAASGSACACLSSSPTWLCTLLEIPSQRNTGDAPAAAPCSCCCTISHLLLTVHTPAPPQRGSAGAQLPPTLKLWAPARCGWKLTCSWLSVAAHTVASPGNLVNFHRPSARSAAVPPWSAEPH